MALTQRTDMVGTNGGTYAQQALKNRFHTAAALLNGKIAPGSVFLDGKHHLNKQEAIRIIVTNANVALQNEESPFAKRNIIEALQVLSKNPKIGNAKSIAKILGDRALVESIVRQAQETDHVVPLKNEG